MISQIFIISFIVFAIWYTMQEGEIFGFVHRLFYGIPEKLKQPLFECPVCMTFWYGSVVYWLLWENNFIEWLVTVIAAIGLNAIISKMFPEEIDIPLKVEIIKKKPVKRKIIRKRK